MYIYICVYMSLSVGTPRVSECGTPPPLDLLLDYLPFLCLCVSLFRAHARALSLSLLHTRTHTHTRTLRFTYTHTHTRTHTYTHTHTYTNSLPCSRWQQCHQIWKLVPGDLETRFK